VSQNLNRNKHEMAMKYKEFDITPGMPKLYKMIMRNMGYTTIDALRDLVDNAIDAAAKELHTYIVSGQGGKPKSFIIADNGCGMPAKILQESFRLASDVEHGKNDLGKFGFGGTAASYSLANCKTVLTKESGGELSVATLHTDYLDSGPKARNLEVTEEHKRFFMKYLKIDKSKYDQSSGTVLFLSEVDGLDYKMAHHLRNKALEVFGQTYYHFITNGLKINFHIVKQDGSSDTKTVKASSPLFWDVPGVHKYKHEEEIEFKGEKITLRYAILNPDSDIKTKATSDNGIYLNRENRQILAASTLGGMWTKTAQFNWGRMEIDFPASLDDYFKTKAQKNGVVPVAELAEILKEKVRKFRVKVRELYSKPAEVTDEITKEEELFAEKVNKLAEELELPEVKRAPIGTPNPSAGRGPDKSKRKPKGSTKIGKRATRTEIRFEHVEPTVPTHTPWYHSMDENMNTVISINNKHNFIQTYYEQGSPETKEALRALMTASTLSAISYGEHNQVEAYIDDRNIKLSTIHKMV